MIRDHLVNLFGENEQFALDMAKKMKYKILEDLCKNKRKEEYHAEPKLALPFSLIVMGDN